MLEPDFLKSSVKQPLNNINNSADFSCLGFCRKCNKNHTLRGSLALDSSLELMELLSSNKRIDLTVSETEADPRFSTDYLFGKAKGMMFGVMVYQDQEGNHGAIPAFSGQYNSVWDVEGWAPPLFEVTRFNNIVTDVDREIKDLSRKITFLKKGSTERVEMGNLRKKLSQGLMRDIHQLYKVNNFRGETESIYNAFSRPTGIPNGTGDCCAPKLLNYAIVNRLTPIGIAEFYWGKENSSKTKQKGVFYQSCQEKCQPILGFMLCGLERDLEDF